MKRSLAAVGLASCVALLLTGCLPERISWSPDGRHALVLSDHLYVTDAQGRLTKLTDTTARSVAWFADSKRFVAVRQTRSTRKWSEVAELLPPKDRQAVVAMAEQFRAEILGLGEKDLGKLPRSQGLDAFVLEMMKMYLAASHAPELRPKLGATWGEFERASAEIHAVTVARVETGSLKDERTVVQWPATILNAAVSPNSKLIAFTTAGFEKRGGFTVSAARLYVASLSEKKGKADPWLVCDRSSWQFDWSPDGRSLAYTAAVGSTGGKNLHLGSLVKHEVASQAGQLAEPPGKSEEIAAVVFSPVTRQRWLEDGRIVFVSSHLEIPATAGSMPQDLYLYVVHPDTGAVVSRVLPDAASQSLPELKYLFRLSPDGRRVSVPGTKGQVAAAEIRTGKTRTIVGEDWAKDQQFIVPVWRSPEELCVMVPAGCPHGSPKRPEIVLYGTDGQPRCISKSWPDAVIQGLTGSK
jgi:hypothetical protein